MRKLGWTTVGVLSIAGVLIVGCQPITIPVEVGLGGSASFPVTAGVPATKSLTAANTNTSGIDVGQGNLELEPGAITINRTNGGGKIRVQAQAAASCTEQAEGVVSTCLADGLDSATCEAQGVAFLANCLSGAGQVEVTVWVTSFEAAQSACASGEGVDTYGPYILELDENDEVTSISGNPQSLQDSTIEWFNTVGLRLCIEVVAGFDGEVVIDSLTFNVGR